MLAAHRFSCRFVAGEARMLATLRNLFPLPIKIDIPGIKTVWVLNGPDLLADDPVVWFQRHTLPPCGERCLYLALTVELQSLPKVSAGGAILQTAVAFRLTLEFGQVRTGDKTHRQLAVRRLADVEAAKLCVADNVCFVDEEDVGHGLKAKERPEMVFRVHSVGKGRCGALNVGTGFSRSLEVDSHGDDRDLSLSVMGAEFLPDRQLLATCSPGSPHEKNQLAPTVVAQVHDAAIHGRQGKIGNAIADG